MSRFTRSLMILCVLPFTLAACVVDGEDEFYDDSELSADDEIEVGTDTAELEAVPYCQDLVLQQAFQKFCGFQDGPLDDSPVYVLCTRTCVTDRYITIDASVLGGGVTCETGDTECTPWVCPPCWGN